MDTKEKLLLLCGGVICLILSLLIAGTSTYVFDPALFGITSAPTSAPSGSGTSSGGTSSGTASTTVSGTTSTTGTGTASGGSGTPQPSVANTALSPAVNPSTFTQYINYDLTGTDVSGQTNANPATCLTNCASNPACTYYVTDAAGQLCWLKSNPTVFTYNSNRTTYTQAGSPTFTPVGVLNNGQWLFNGGTNPSAVLVSPNGLYIATLQGDGNLCVHRTDTNKLCWCSSAGGSGTPLKLIVQPDNNVVIYANATNDNTTGTSAGKAIWSSGTSGKGTAGQATLNLQSDGNMVIYSGTTAIWASGSNGC